MMRRELSIFLFIMGLFPLFLCGSPAQASDNNPYKLYVGWSSKSITPDKPVALAGQFRTRISRKTMDPVTCTALALETRDGNKSVETAIMVSVDVAVIRGALQDEVVALLKKKLPGFDTKKLVLNATHTHTGPVLNTGRYDIPDDAIQPDEYVKFASKQISDAAAEAWNSRKPGGMSWGLGHASIGYNRRAVYFEPVPSGFGKGTAVMYGNTSQENFSHMEGYEDHGLEMLFFWDEQKKLTGMVLNVACPTQETEGMSQLSADYWHEARLELHERYGENVYILPQVAAAGDISPHLQWRKAAEMEMLKRKGINRRQELGRRIANAVDEVYPYVQDDIQYEIVFNHLYDEVNLPVRKVTKEEYEQAERLAQEQPDRASWHRGITDRYNKQDANPYYPVKVNVMRLGDVAVATNPFELFLDFGLRMKNRSKAIMTFIVQLANGGGTYVPTTKAEAGGGYSAIVQSNSVGSEGGQVLVNKTVELINSNW